MNNSILKNSTFKTTTWSGGTTTELFIYPETADYKRKDFSFRLSTATVEIEQSTFTPLPNVSRTLMVLDGVMTLLHKNHHTKTVAKFEGDNFEGGWETSSIGQCVDFNLMTIGKTRGDLNAVLVKEKQQITLPTESANWFSVYTYRGSFNFGKEIVEQGDLLMIQNPTSEIIINGLTSCELIVTKVYE